MNIRMLAACVVLAVSPVVSAQTHRDSFVYQGELLDMGGPANGLYDISFIVYDSEVGGSIVFGGAQTVLNVEVVDGRFEALVDFGITGTVFDSNQIRWLSVRVRPSGGVGFQELSPRQRLTPAPLANYALRSGTSLQGAYDNGGTIFRGAGGPVEIRSSGTSPARLNLGSLTGNEAAGELYMLNSSGNLMFTAEEDIDPTGGGFLALTRNNSGSYGMLVDGNSSNTESTQVTLLGNTNSMVISTRLDGDASVQIPNNAINAREILNEVGASEFASGGSTVLTNDAATIDVVGSVTINCPSNGFVLVLSSSELTIGHTTGTESTVNIGVSNANASIPGNGDLETRVPAGAATGFYDYTVSTHAIFTAFEGSNTFYLLGDQNSIGSSATVLDTQLSAIFIPTSYGNLNREPGMNIDDDHLAPSMPMTNYQILQEQNAALRANDERMQREFDEMKAKMDQLIEQTNQQLRLQQRD